MQFHPSMNALAQMIPFGVGGAVKNGININLDLVHRAFVVCLIQQGADGATPTITLGQSTVGAGTGTGTSEKAMSADCPVYYNQNCATSNLLTKATATLGAYTFGNDQSRTKMAIFEVDPSLCMDVANGFDVLVLNTSDPAAANILGAFAILEPRYGPLPTVFSD
jgi:hypothetical protein